MKNKRCFVFDLDGTVYLGDIPIQPTVDFICKNWGILDFYFLSNNTSKSPESYVQKLNKMGIKAELKHILTPITSLIEHLRQHQIFNVYALGNTEFLSYFQANMPEAVLGTNNCQAVILAYDTELTYEKLKISALLLQDSNIAFLATHPDMVCPTPQGPIPDVGSFIELYYAATGRRPEHVFGKPNTSLLQSIFEKYSKEQVVMVGDRLSTDKLLADNAQIDFILVLSGEAKREDLLSLAKQPKLVLEHLGELDTNY